MISLASGSRTSVCVCVCVGGGLARVVYQFPSAFTSFFVCVSSFLSIYLSGCLVLCLVLLLISFRFIVIVWVVVPSCTLCVVKVGTAGVVV